MFVCLSVPLKSAGFSTFNVNYSMNVQYSTMVVDFKRNCRRFKKLHTFETAFALFTPHRTTFCRKNRTGGRSTVGDPLVAFKWTVTALKGSKVCIECKKYLVHQKRFVARFAERKEWIAQKTRSIQFLTASNGELREMINCWVAIYFVTNARNQPQNSKPLSTQIFREFLG